MEFRRQDGGLALNINPIYSDCKEDAGINLATVYARAEKDAGVNGALGIAGVNGNAGVNGALIGAGVEGNAGVNGALCYGSVGKLEDYSIGDVLPRMTKYLPEFIRQINLPAVNLGVVTNTKEIRNGFVFGLYNNLEDRGEDYVASGLINRVKDSEENVRYHFLVSGRITIDGVFSHKPKKGLEETVEEK